MDGVGLGGRLIGGPSRQVGAAGDQARAAFVGRVGPRPLNEYQQAVAKADEKKNVDEQPGEPGDEAGDVDASELGDGGGAADGGQAALVPVVDGAEVGSFGKIPALSRRAREGRGTRALFFEASSLFNSSSLRINLATKRPC